MATCSCPAGAVLVFAAVAVLAGVCAAAPTTPLQAGKKVSDASMALDYISGNPEITPYLDNPNTVCTIWIPNNPGFMTSLGRLGASIGLFAQNETMITHFFNYTITPDRAIKADTVKNGTLPTRTGEPLYTMRYNNKLYVFSDPKYPAEVVTTNIPLGKCIGHLTTEVLSPPSQLPTVNEWWDNYAKDSPAEHKKDLQKNAGVTAAAKALMSSLQQEKEPSAVVAEAGGETAPAAGQAEGSAPEAAAPAAGGEAPVNAATPAPPQTAGSEGKSPAGLMLLLAAAGAAVFAALL